MTDLPNPRMFPPSGQTGGSDAQAPAASSLASPVSTLGTAIYDEPGARWRNYACTHHRKMERWVTPDEMARIDAGITAGTIEVRQFRNLVGIIHQFRELPSNPQPSVTAPASSQNSGV